MRSVRSIVLLAVVVTAGCAGPVGDGPAPTAATTQTTQIPEPSTTATETATAELLTTRTTETLSDVDSEPRKGDQFLSVMELNESEAMELDSNRRAAFENLSAERQRVVREAVECDCNVELDGEFDFNDRDRIEVVAYDGTYYYLRIAIV